ncbi:hypothetical protein KBY58_07655 [Cyanobium sp. HWJ4-Hawea]|uniref:DUF6629 family protein n=1 Tax=Cyanobium sp. HWJ4-Hawea TaxID=2823713 RepID=UPI0020CF8D25|nr:DUF6629 family protein [Cyanobium sp. HWJ4-Hawea]MCP9809306.1 hypothetical protein [Cyanobium sp. HWJ4-Hawea]
MCFSASASFTASAILIPLGIYSTHIARKTDQPSYVPLAMVPMFFGIQQLIEGFVWTFVKHDSVEPWTRISSLGFLFFAYCFWMIWIPWSAYAIARVHESSALRHRLKWVAIVATVLGIAFYVPLLFSPPLVQPNLTTGRMLYDISGLHSVIHNFVTTEPVGEMIYWAFIVLPLVVLRDKAVKLFGVLIFVSIFLTWLTYAATFNSVWCFYCAILSIYVIWIVNRPTLKTA